MAKETIKEMLEMIDAKIEHIEDISADNRAIIVKLVKQSNTIVQFLRNLEADIDEEHGIEAPSSFTNTVTIDSDKIDEMKELFEEFKARKEDLKELEKELKKHKGDLTPGQVGES